MLVGAHTNLSDIDSVFGTTYLNANLIMRTEI